MFEDRKGYLLVVHHSRTYKCTLLGTAYPYKTQDENKRMDNPEVYKTQDENKRMDNPEVYKTQDENKRMDKKGKGQKNKQHNTLKTED
jgi:hypothetical protein